MIVLPSLSDVLALAEYFECRYSSHLVPWRSSNEERVIYYRLGLDLLLLIGSTMTWKHEAYFLEPRSLLASYVSAWINLVSLTHSDCESGLLQTERLFSMQRKRWVIANGFQSESCQKSHLLETHTRTSVSYTS